MSSTFDTVLAIDPGFERVGIAILARQRANIQNVIYSTCFKTSSKTPFPERLLHVGAELEKIIKKFKPQVLAIEKLYFTTNQKTAMSVAEARGVIIYIAEKNGLEIFEYTPPEIKVAVTGFGKADKSMMINMVRKLSNVPNAKTSDDELDAIGIGLTYLARERF